MKKPLFGCAVILALSVVLPAARAQNQNNQGQQDGVARLDHVFVIVLENHNSFTSFGSNGIIGNPQAPNITALWNKYNIATNYNGVWHPSLPNYVAMITGDWTGNDVIGTGHTYPVGSNVGISDDDSPSVAADYCPRPTPPSISGPSTCLRSRVNWSPPAKTGARTCRTSLNRAPTSPIGQATATRLSCMR